MIVSQAADHCTKTGQLTLSRIFLQRVLDMLVTQLVCFSGFYSEIKTTNGSLSRKDTTFKTKSYFPNILQVNVIVSQDCSP